MAKIQSPFKIHGSVGNVTYYENEYGQQMKEKGGPTAWQVKNLERFTNTRHNAAEWKNATAASRLVRHAMVDLLRSVKNIRLSGRMNGPLLAAIHGDTVHDYGERTVGAGNLSVLSGFEFNHKLLLEDALPLNIENCFSLEAGKLSVDVPAFRIRKKQGIPKDATHYRLVSCILYIDFDKRTYHQDKQVSELYAMGRKAGAAFSMEQVVQPDNEQGCFWLMGIEFYKLVNGAPALVRGGALRVMQWVGKACAAEIEVPTMAVSSFADEVLAAACVEEQRVAETGVEAVGAAYMETMEDIFEAAQLEGAAFIEALTAYTDVDEVAVVMEAEGSTDPEAFIVSEVDEGDVALAGDPAEFEKSLRVVLPVEAFQRLSRRTVGMVTDRLYAFGKINV